MIDTFLRVSAALNNLDGLWYAFLWMGSVLSLGVWCGWALTVRYYRDGVDYQRRRQAVLRQRRVERERTKFQLERGTPTEECEA